MAEAERQLDRSRTPGGRPIAHAHDLELLGEALRDADDHVVDQGPHEPVHGAVHALVVGTLDHQRLAVLPDRDGAGDVALERSLRALHGDVAIGDRHIDAAGYGDRCLADSGHVRSASLPHQTKHRTSPPTRRLRASRSDRSPWLVDSTATPSPPRTRGTSLDLE